MAAAIHIHTLHRQEATCRTPSPFSLSLEDGPSHEKACGIAPTARSPWPASKAELTHTVMFLYSLVGAETGSGSVTEASTDLLPSETRSAFGGRTKKKGGVGDS
jgi:hypothetical protein